MCHNIINVVLVTVMMVFVLSVLRIYVVSPFQVDGHSMENTLMDGEHMFLFKMTSIDRFDIVVFPDPNGKDTFYIKRLIGLPGERLYVQDDQLYINDVPLAEPYLEEAKSVSPSPFTTDFTLRDTLGIDIIPEGYAFVMGDNRPYSGDSRQFGLIPLDSIIGEASVVYSPWSNRRMVTEYVLDDATQSLIMQE